MTRAEAEAEVEWLRKQEGQLREDITRRRRQLASLAQRREALCEILRREDG